MTYTIIGGGIAGLTTAIALQRIGIEARIFEAAPAIKPVGAGILLAGNAIKAFQRLGIQKPIIARGSPLPTLSILNQKGNVLSYADTKAISRQYGLHNFAIHRAELHAALFAELNDNQIILNKRATGIKQIHKKTRIHFADATTYETDALIVADGIHSAVRQQLMPEATIRYAGYTCWRAVITNPELELSGASETWGRGKRFGIVPLANDQIYWFACVNAPENDPISKAYQAEDLQRIFGDFHEPIPTILEHTQDDDLIWNDILDIKPISRFAFGNVVLIGDAAHATTPNMGQGACQAIEDAVVLADELANHDAPAAAFAAFERRRMKRTHFVVNASWRLGKIAQWRNPIAVALRNTLVRLTPDAVNEQQFKRLLEVDF